nr:hypothetical protein [Tanacetum cinerariifolium]
MDQQYTTVAKSPMLDTGKFEQWQFRMQQYLHHEHYALWEVIEFEDSYTAPENSPSTMTTSTTSGEKSGRTVTLTTEDMQKKNDTWKKISIQGSDVAGFDKSKVECFNCHKMGYFARECRAPKNQERGRRDTYRQGSKAKEQTPKALITIDGVGWDWSYMANNEEDHALVAEAPTEFALMANTSTENKGKMECIETLKKDLETLKQEKEAVDGKLAGLLSASKNLDNLIESQRSDKSKE